MSENNKQHSKIYLTIGELSNKLGVCTKTIRRWESQGKIHVSFRTTGGHRRFSIEEVEKCIRKINFCQQDLKHQKNAVIYARVSSQRQIEDLQRQIALLVTRAKADHSFIRTIYKDVGSGLNDI